VNAEVCQWYALCVNEAVGTVDHSILGKVPVCHRCATKHDMDVDYYEKEEVSRD
jgi:hypothetical protein